jgi:NAD(P)H dehydrogenase (quinone)
VDRQFVENIPLNGRSFQSLLTLVPGVAVVPTQGGSYTGVNIPVPGYGKFAPASRYDLGAAHAAILAGTGHEGKSYQLYGDPAVSFRHVAAIISKLSGKPVPYNQISEEAFTETTKAAGFPDFVGGFAIRWIKGMDAGEWEPLGSDLEKLLGRKPTSTEETMRTTYFQPVAAV